MDGKRISILPIFPKQSRGATVNRTSAHFESIRQREEA